MRKVPADVKYQLNKLIQKLEGVKASATELLSLYIPPDSNINDVKNQLSDELSVSSNIKSKQTRKAVLSAIDKTLNELKKYRKTPGNGLIIFCGDMSQEPGRPDTEIVVLNNLPVPVNTRLYRTKQGFVLNPLKQMVNPKNVYGLISVDKNDAAIALLKGTNVDVKVKMSSCIPGKFKAGGQSQARFSRVRENLTKSWYDDVSRKANEVFTQVDDLKGIVVGGPSQTKKEFLAEEKLHHEIRDKVLTVINTGYAGEDGIRELVNKAEEVFEKENIMIEKRLINKFFKRLAKDQKVTYGLDEVMKTTKMGAVSKIILTDNLEEELVDEVVRTAKNYSTKVVIVSTETEEGERLKLMGGVGAFLRYDLGTS